MNRTCISASSLNKENLRSGPRLKSNGRIRSWINFLIPLLSRLCSKSTYSKSREPAAQSSLPPYQRRFAERRVWQPTYEEIDEASPHPWLPPLTRLKADYNGSYRDRSRLTHRSFSVPKGRRSIPSSLPVGWKA